MDDRVVATPPSSGSARSSPHSRRPLIIILCALALLVSGSRRLSAIDPRLSRCFSVSGLTGLLWYLSGNFVEAARAYRAHYETAGEPIDEPVAPDYVALVMGDLRLAEDAANRALQEDPRATGPKLTLAELALRRGDDVLALQSALLLDGVYPGKGKSKNDCPRSVKIGPCTLGAIDTFQKKYGIKGEENVVGERTREVLNNKYSVRSI